VVPRVRVEECGAALPLHQRIESLLNAGFNGPVNLYGPPGSGKTTALEHISAVLPKEAPVRLCDLGIGAKLLANARPHEVFRRYRSSAQLIVVTSDEPIRGLGCGLEMVSWSEDEAIEYLLAVHPDRCASVMPRLRGCDCAMLGGLPELWRIVLDTMAADPSLADLPGAIRQFMASNLVDPNLRDAVMQESLRHLQAGAGGADALPRSLRGTSMPVLPPMWHHLAAYDKSGTVCRLVRHRPVQIALAAQWLLWELRRGAGHKALACRMPRDLVREIAALLAVARLPASDSTPGGPDAALQRLEELFKGPDKWLHSLSATLLHTACVDFAPVAGQAPDLAGAYLIGAKWARTDLSGINFALADLSGADLTETTLDGTNLAGTDFSRACLCGASLASVKAGAANFSSATLNNVHAHAADFDGADFSAADLSGADFTSAQLKRADLSGATATGARFRGAVLARTKVEGADFSDADFSGARISHVRLNEARLTGACFREATLVGCNLENAQIESADFRGSCLKRSYLTGSQMPGARFTGADLRKTGLAEVEWEGADLRRANLAGASFHLGSTRSGLVGSPIACEGSRTGFYTDDFNDQDFKSPEEIRKANLCGADLRGAKIRKVDFYLVDLRGARYTKKQEQHLRRCRAILDQCNSAP
jgi:uncharacterized protein YjbI with pentapeptide repeats